MTKAEWIRWAEKRADENMKRSLEEPDQKDWYLAKYDTYQLLALKFQSEMQ